MFLLASAAIALFVDWNARRLARHEAEDKALLIANRAAATLDYLKAASPAEWGRERSPGRPEPFDPGRMSSHFVMRDISRRFDALSADAYYYKEAALNARNPGNLPDEVERAFFEEAARPGGPASWAGVKVIAGKPWYVRMQRGDVIDPSCLRCHGEPDHAPQGLVERYGAEAGFGWRPGELASVISIRVPLEDAYLAADAFSIRLSFVLLVAFAILLGAFVAVNRRLVFGPLARVREHATLVARGERSLSEQVPLPRGRDLQALTDAFNAMSERVSAEKDGLEQQVAERTRQALTSEARYQLLFDDNPMPMWVYDADTLEFVAVNTAAIDHYGHTREAFLGMTLRELRPPQDLELFERVRATIPASRSRSGIFRHVKRSGEIIDVEIVSHGVQFLGRRCRLVLANDVTERLRAERALRESEELYQLITDGVPMRIGYVDVEQRYRFVNRAYELDLGLPRAGIVGRTIREIFSGTVYASLRPRIEAVLRGEHVTFEAILPLQRGLRDQAITLVPRLDERGAVVGFFAISADVTERRELENHLRHAQKMEAVGQLAGGIAHDFNNILTVISSLAHIVSQSERLGGEERSDLAEIERAAKRAADLTRSLLAFSRKQTLRPRHVMLDEVVADAERMLRRLVREDIALETDLAAGESGWVLADTAQLEQVLMNLVVNARDAMPGGGTVRIRTAEAEIDEQPPRPHPDMAPGPYVLLAVSDTGLGMSPEVLARAFEPFFTTKPKGQGTGLGLATVYGVVTQSGGHVQISSAPGSGTTVAIYLPRAAPAAERRAAPAPVEASGGTEALVLVEDEGDVREVARRALVQLGYRVLCAANGEEALALARAHAGRVALVVTDVIMPGMGGRELARQLEQLSPAPPVLFMSGYAGDELGPNGVLGLGVAFLQKPFTSEGLAHAVRDALDRHRGRAPLTGAAEA